MNTSLKNIMGVFIIEENGLQINYSFTIFDDMGIAQLYSPDYGITAMKHLSMSDTESVVESITAALTEFNLDPSKGVFDTKDYPVTRALEENFFAFLFYGSEDFRKVLSKLDFEKVTPAARSMIASIGGYNPRWYFDEIVMRGVGTWVKGGFVRDDALTRPGAPYATSYDRYIFASGGPSPGIDLEDRRFELIDQPKLQHGGVSLDDYAAQCLAAGHDVIDII